MQKSKKYVGIHNDLYGGMTDTGKIIRDAWAFGLIPESESCEGWLVQGLENLWRQVNERWETYGFSVSQLPEEIQERYLHIQEQAIARAKSQGWDADRDLMAD